MKHFLLTILLTFTAIAAMSQYRYSVENCWEMAKNNYPAIKYFNLIEKSKDYSLSNASEMKLPKKIDAFTFISSTDSKKSAISLANKNNISTYNALNSIKTPSENQNPLVAGSLQANLYVLSERINNLFFSLVLIDKQIKTNEMFQLQLIELNELFSEKGSKLNNNINLKGISALQEKARKDYSTLINLQKVYYNMLSQMIGRTIDKKNTLMVPNIGQNLKKSNNIKNIGLIDNNKYNPFTNKVNLAPRNYIYGSSNYQVFDVAKVKVNYPQKNKNSNFPPLQQSLLNNNIKNQQESERAEINTLWLYIEEDYRNINITKEYVMVSYNKISRGVTDISNFTQNIINHIDAVNKLSAHTVQLMMEANKFKFLYE